MSTALWAAQIFAALIFLLAGTAKLVLPRETLSRRMRWAQEWPRWRIKLLGLAEVAGAAGLILPAVTGVAPVLTPIAALCLAVLMGGAIAAHRRLHESFVPAAVVAVLCVGIAAGQVSTMRRTNSAPTQDLRIR